jgi:hypothetical protein
MSRRERKGLWLAAGLSCIGVGLNFVAQMRQAQEPELRAVPSKRIDSPSISSTAGTAEVAQRRDDTPLRSDYPAEERQRIADRRVPAGEASRSANSPAVESSSSMAEARFLEPDVDAVWVNQAPINSDPVNVGRYLDPNLESAVASASHANSIEQTPVHVGEYLDPEPETAEVIGHHW